MYRKHVDEFESKIEQYARHQDTESLCELVKTTGFAILEFADPFSWFLKLDQLFENGELSNLDEYIDQYWKDFRCRRDCISRIKKNVIKARAVADKAV